MSEEAIHQDVSAAATDQVEAVETPNTESADTGTEAKLKHSPLDDREAKLAKMYADREAELTGEGDALHPINREVYGNKNEIEQADGLPAEQPSTETGRTTPSQSQPASSVYRNEAGEEVMKLKVNGVEQEVPLNQIRATAQKNWAADQRLEQAAQYQRNLQQYEAQLKEREQQLQQTMQPPHAGADTDMTEIARSIVDGLYEGDTESATAKLAEVLAGRGNATFDPNTLTEQAVQKTLSAIEQREQQRLAEARKSEIETANRNFSEKYREIWENESLYAVAQQKTIALQQAHPDWTPAQVISEAGEQTQKWVNELRGKVANVADASSREAAKKNLKPIPQARSARHSPEQRAQVDHSPKAVIEAMRRERQPY